jgi:hypothetical protein
MLCSLCQYIFDHLDEVPTTKGQQKTFPFHNDTSSMKRAAMDGCLLCGQFLQILESSNVWKDVSVDRGVAVELADSKSSTIDWRMKLYCDRSAVPHYCVPITLVSVPKRGAFSLNSRYKVSSLSGIENNAPSSHGITHERNSKETLPLVNQWLQSCLAKHEDCRVIK